MASARDEKFPRSIDLPGQSPRFWAEQKDRYLRQLLIRDIEEKTGRRFVVYFANRFANALIDARDPAYMAELLSDLRGAEFDLLIETGGGYTDATEALVALIKNYGKQFRAIVASAAKSNGTLLCLAAQKILMGVTSELGPIDPQLQGIPATILSQPDYAKVNFIVQQQAIHAINQTKKLAATLLAEGMMKGRSQAEIDGVVHKLSSRDVYYSHGSVIDFNEAKNLSLDVEYLGVDDELWRRIWLLYCMYEFDCRRSGLLKVFEGNRASTAVAVPPPPPRS